MFKNRKGFTLIELLVVIAIIGILSSVVLASLNAARGKGNNAKIKAQMAAARAAAEIYFDGNSSKYGVANNCTTAMFSDSVSGMNKYSDYNNYPGAASGDIACFSTDTAYSMSVKLNTAEGTNTHWCIGSAGMSKGVAAAVTTATSCQ